MIDSEELIKQSYRDAGVEPPEDILAQESTDWLHKLIPPEVDRIECRRAKNHAYLMRLSHDPFKTLPPYDVAVRLQHEGHQVSMLSGAPLGTIAMLRKRLHPWPFTTFAYAGLRTPDKMRILHADARKGIYVDDQERLVDVPFGWIFVHYANQTADELYEELTR